MVTVSLDWLYFLSFTWISWRISMDSVLSLFNCCFCYWICYNCSFSFVNLSICNCWLSIDFWDARMFSFFSNFSFFFSFLEMAESISFSYSLSEIPSINLYYLSSFGSFSSLCFEFTFCFLQILDSKLSIGALLFFNYNVALLMGSSFFFHEL